MKETLYELLNYVDTDYEKYENVEVSQDEKDRLKNRISKKIAEADSNDKESLQESEKDIVRAKSIKQSYFVKATAVAAACFVLAGSVAIANSMKNKKVPDNDDAQNNAAMVATTETAITTEAAVETSIQISNTDKSVFNENLDMDIYYSVKQQGDGNIELTSIDKTDKELNLNCQITFDKSVDLTELMNALDKQSQGADGDWCYLSTDTDAASSPAPNTFEGIYTRTTISDEDNNTEEKAPCHGVSYKFDNNTLSLDMKIDTDKIEDLDFKTLRLVMVVGKPYKSTFNIKIELPSFKKATEINERNASHDINLISSVENYGYTSYIEITGYSILGNNIEFYGNYSANNNYDELSEDDKARWEADGINSAYIEHRIRAWDDLGNCYVFMESYSNSYKWILVTGAGNFKSELDPNATKLTFVIEKKFCNTTIDDPYYDYTSLPYDYDTPPVTIDLKTGDILDGSSLTDPLTAGGNGVYEIVPLFGGDD